jgi:hypothetical protein
MEFIMAGSNRVSKRVPNWAILDSTGSNQLDRIELNGTKPGSNIAFVMKGSPVQVRASASARACAQEIGVPTRLATFQAPPSCVIGIARTVFSSPV